MLILYNFTQAQKYFTRALLVLLVTNIMSAVRFMILCYSISLISFELQLTPIATLADKKVKAVIASGERSGCLLLKRLIDMKMASRYM